MNVTKRVVPDASEHCVQFFDSQESRAEVVGRFLAAGYPKGEALVVVAQPANWNAIAQRLLALGVPIQPAIDRGQLYVKDAYQTLGLLSPQGSPTAAAFEAHVGTLIRSL